MIRVVFLFFFIVVPSITAIPKGMLFQGGVPPKPIVQVYDNNLQIPHTVVYWHKVLRLSDESRKYFAGAIKRVMREYGGRIKLAASKHGIPWELLCAITVVESNGDPNALSHAGAIGLTQMKIGTALDMGIENPAHPYESLLGGAKYLKVLDTDYPYNGVKQIALAYHDGPTGALKYLESNPPDAHPYVQKVTVVLRIVHEIYSTPAIHL